METIRLLRPDDAEAFKKLRLDSLVSDPLSWLSTLDEENNLPMHAFSNKLSYATSPPIFGYYGYFENGNLLAYAQIANSYWRKKKHVVILYDICVSKDTRRKNVGTKLVSYIIKKAESTPHIKQIQLWVTSKNSAAISFYEKLGFKKLASTENTVQERDGSYQDEYLYTLKFDHKKK